MYQCLVWLFPVAFVGKNKEQTMNVLLGASELLFTLQSLCPEPSQAAGSGKGRGGAVCRVWFLCAQLWGEENKAMAVLWGDVWGLLFARVVPSSEGNLFWGRYCPCFPLGSGTDKGLGKKKHQQKWVAGEGKYLNSVIFLLE